MSETAASPSSSEPVAERLRRGLEREDAILSGVAPVLRHLLANEDRALFGDAVIARMRGMIDDVARQLAESLGEQGGEMQPLLAAALTDNAGFLGHLHALALEWQVAEHLHERFALDPVLSPLVQALIASPDPDTAALAMTFLAAQARFAQAQRRMRLPVGELPGDLLHGALVALRGVAGPEREGPASAALAAIRAEYDEARSRLGLMSRLVTGMGGGAVAALSIRHAGAALFVTALATASTQGRDLTVLAMSETQHTRLALALCAAGLKPSAIAEQLLVLQPDAEVAGDLDHLDAESAAALLALTGA